MNPTRIRCTLRTETYCANGKRSTGGCSGSVLPDFTVALLVAGGPVDLELLAGMHNTNG